MGEPVRVRIVGLLVRARGGRTSFGGPPRSYDRAYGVSPPFGLLADFREGGGKLGISPFAFDADGSVAVGFAGDAEEGAEIIASDAGMRAVFFLGELTVAL